MHCKVALEECTTSIAWIRANVVSGVPTWAIENRSHPAGLWEHVPMDKLHCSTVLWVSSGGVRGSPGGLNDALLCLVMRASSAFMQGVVVYERYVDLRSTISQLYNYERNVE